MSPTSRGRDSRAAAPRGGPSSAPPRTGQLLKDRPAGWGAQDSFWPPQSPAVKVLPQDRRCAGTLTTTVLPARPGGRGEKPGRKASTCHPQHQPFLYFLVEYLSFYFYSFWKECLGMRECPGVTWQVWGCLPQQVGPRLGLHLQPLCSPVWLCFVLNLIGAVAVGISPSPSCLRISTVNFLVGGGEQAPGTLGWPQLRMATTQKAEGTFEARARFMLLFILLSVPNNPHTVSGYQY